MNEVYSQGWVAGYNNEDSRSCPYEGTALVNEWLNGWYDGQERLESSFK